MLSKDPFFPPSEVQIYSNQIYYARSQSPEKLLGLLSWYLRSSGVLPSVQW